MISSNSLAFSKIEFPKDICLVFPLYLEDYWLLREVERLQQIYPKMDWVGIFDPQIFTNFNDFEFHLPKNSFFKFEKVKNKPLWVFKDVRTFEEASHLPIRSQIERFVNTAPFFVISPSHIISRFRARFFAKKYSNLQIISIDAHKDISTGIEIENRWISDDILPFVSYIGSNSLNSPIFNFHFHDISTAIDNPLFIETLQNKPVFLSVDLDFFSKTAYGLASYWFREQFIGHSINYNLRQKLAAAFYSSSIGSEVEYFSVGEKVGYFRKDESSTFLAKRERIIKEEAVFMHKMLSRLISTLKDISFPILGIDLTEICSLGDVKDTTCTCLGQMLVDFSSILEE